MIYDFDPVYLERESPDDPNAPPTGVLRPSDPYPQPRPPAGPRPDMIEPDGPERELRND
jgi:hypothetical protein